MGGGRPGAGARLGCLRDRSCCPRSPPPLPTRRSWRRSPPRRRRSGRVANERVRQTLADPRYTALVLAVGAFVDGAEWPRAPSPGGGAPGGEGPGGGGGRRRRGGPARAPGRAGARPGRSPPGPAAQALLEEGPALRPALGRGAARGADRGQEAALCGGVLPLPLQEKEGSRLHPQPRPAAGRPGPPETTWRAPAPFLEALRRGARPRGRAAAVDRAAGIVLGWYARAAGDAEPANGRRLAGLSPRRRRSGRSRRRRRRRTV